MKYQRVLFVIPDLQGFYTTLHPHPGIGYLTEFLSGHSINCSVLDLSLGYSYRHLHEKIRTFSPDLVGVTLYSFNRDMGYEVVREVKQHHDLPVIIGGPHVSQDRGKTLPESGADYAMCNEGEYPLLQLCQGAPLDSIPNLYYWVDGELRENSRAKFIVDLDQLPWPKYVGFELNKYGGPSVGMEIVSTRGCPHECSFCTVAITMGRNFRQRSLKHLMSELRYWYDLGWRDFNFIDDTFLQFSRRAYELCDMIEREGWKGVTFNCSQGIRADKAPRLILTRMREVGFKALALGVESFNDHTLQVMKKRVTTQQLDECVKVACELGFDVGLFFVIGLPDDTPEDVERSFAFALKYPVRYANFYQAMPYPGTALADWIENHGTFLQRPENYLYKLNIRIREPIFTTPTLSLQDIRRLHRKGDRVSREIQRKRREYQLQRLGLFRKPLAWALTSKWLLDPMRVHQRGPGRMVFRLGYKILKPFIVPSPADVPYHPE